MSDKERLFTRDFILISAIALCSTMNYFLILIIITSFSMEEFAVSDAEAGLSAGLFIIGGLSSRLLLGKYIELVGRKRMLLIALSAAFLMSLTYFFVSSMAMLYLIRFAHGLAYGLTNNCTSDIIAKIVPPSRRGEGLGYYALSVTISTSLGPLIGMSLAPNYTAVFMVGTCMYIIAPIFAILARIPEETLTEEQKREAKSFSIHNMLQFSAIPIAVVITIAHFAYSGVLSFISEYSSTLEAITTASVFYIAVACGTLVSRLTTGKVFDRKGPNAIISLGFVLFVVGMTMFSRAPNDLVFMASGFILGYGMAIIYAVGQASAISKSPVHRYGVTTATYSAIADIGLGIGPMVLGLMIPVLGYNDMYLMCAGIGACTLVIYWLVYGLKERRIRAQHSR